LSKSFRHTGFSGLNSSRVKQRASVVTFDDGGNQKTKLFTVLQQPTDGNRPPYAAIAIGVVDFSYLITSSR